MPTPDEAVICRMASGSHFLLSSYLSHGARTLPHGPVYGKGFT